MAKLKSTHINYYAGEDQHICEVDGKDFDDNELVLKMLVAFDLLITTTKSGRTSQRFCGTVTSNGLVISGGILGG